MCWTERPARYYMTRDAVTRVVHLLVCCDSCKTFRGVCAWVCFAVLLFFIVSSFPLSLCMDVPACLLSRLLVCATELVHVYAECALWSSMHTASTDSPRALRCGRNTARAKDALFAVQLAVFVIRSVFSTC